MKLLLALSLITVLSAFAADPPKKTAIATPEIDQATQIEVLADQLGIAVAQQKAQPFEEQLRKAQDAAQPSLQKALAQCNKDGGDKYTLDVQRSVVCRLKPEAPPPHAGSPNTPPQAATPAQPAK
jgi:hypothetical protein